MKNDVVKVEVNMAATERSKVGKGKVKEEEQPSTYSDVKFDTMMETMERLMDRVALGNNPLVVEPETQVRNPNFRRVQIQ